MGKKHQKSLKRISSKQNKTFNRKVEDKEYDYFLSLHRDLESLINYSSDLYDSKKLLALNHVLSNIQIDITTLLNQINIINNYVAKFRQLNGMNSFLCKRALTYISSEVSSLINNLFAFSQSNLQITERITTEIPELDKNLVQEEANSND